MSNAFTAEEFRQIFELLKLSAKIQIKDFPSERQLRSALNEYERITKAISASRPDWLTVRDELWELASSQAFLEQEARQLKAAKPKVIERLTPEAEIAQAKLQEEENAFAPATLVLQVDQGAGIDRIELGTILEAVDGAVVSALLDEVLRPSDDKVQRDIQAGFRRAVLQAKPSVTKIVAARNGSIELGFALKETLEIVKLLIEISALYLQIRASNSAVGEDLGPLRQSLETLTVVSSHTLAYAIDKAVVAFLRVLPKELQEKIKVTLERKRNASQVSGQGASPTDDKSG